MTTHTHTPIHTHTHKQDDDFSHYRGSQNPSRMNFSNQSAVLNETNLYSCRFKEDFKYLLLPISYSLVFLFGLSLNAMALFVILFRTKRWTPSTIYMLNLTMCDTLYVVTLPFLIYYYADANDWPFGEPVCKIIRFLFYANLYGRLYA